MSAAPPGVEALDHTADVGIQVRASSLEELFRRVALGSVWMAVGSWEPSTELPHRLSEHSLELEGETLAELLRSWSRELLYWQEVEGLLPVEIRELEIERSPDASRARLRARIACGSAPDHPIREIKGVTWHGLGVEKRDDGWCARIIFDV